MSTPEKLRKAEDHDVRPKTEVPPPPHVVRLRARGRGPYYVAPDSAEPIPDGIWQRLDPGEVQAATVRANKQLTDTLTEEDRASANPPLPAGNFMAQSAQDLLRAIGGSVAQEILEGLD